MTVRAHALQAYEALALGVDTKGAQAPSALARKIAISAKGQSIISETSAPAFEVVDKFLYQSYFGLGPTSILSQPVGEQIVSSTLNVQQVAGYAVGLHPSSEAPIAIQFFTGGQQGASAPYRLAPGQVIRPHGRPGDTSGSFSGFQFGLPFGWLGGGSVTLVVLRTPDAQVCWNGSPEIIFHRMNLSVIAANEIPPDSNIVPNWPHRFPWPFATFAATGISQRGQPALAVTPTRVAIRLRNADLSTGPANMRILMYGTNDFDLDQDGVIEDALYSGYQDLTWGQDSTIAGSSGVGTSQYQVQFFDSSPLTRLSCDEGGAIVCVYNPTGSTTDITGSVVDFVRYGRL